MDFLLNLGFRVPVFLSYMFESLTILNYFFLFLMALLQYYHTDVK